MSGARQRRSKTSTSACVTLDNETYSYISEMALVNNLSFSAQLAVLMREIIKQKKSITEQCHVAI